MRLAHATLFVADVARSKAFYLRLGFRLLVDEAHYARFQVGVGPTTLSIHAAEGPIQPSAEIGVVFDDAASLDAYTSEVGAPTPEDKSWLWRESRLTDPDGHVLLLLYAGPNHLDPPWRVGRGAESA